MRLGGRESEVARLVELLVESTFILSCIALLSLDTLASSVASCSARLRVADSFWPRSPAMRRRVRTWVRVKAPTQAPT